MMRILYGVSGDGFGHASRAKVVGGYLKEWGHDLKIMTYGRGYEALKDDFDVFEVKGMEIQFVKGELKRRSTIAYNAKVVADNVSKWRRFRELMKDYDPELCISDMEPIVPILKFWYRKPLICLDNQHRITHLRLIVPRKYYADFLASKAVIENFVSRAEHFIITSFVEAEIKRPNTTIVPPVIREEVRRLKPSYGKKFLVYLTRENRNVIDILSQINEEFVVFGYNVNRKEKNLEYKTRDFFLDELKTCRAIIATAGFTLISEALYLKKPYLALPLKGQFEQVLNSLFLKQAGYGDYSDELRPEDVSAFLEQTSTFKQRLSEYKLDFEKLPDTLKYLINEGRIVQSSG
jgi:uncharacterized protein (TIGR00661 family)